MKYNLPPLKDGGRKEASAIPLFWTLSKFWASTRLRCSRERDNPPSHLEWNGPVTSQNPHRSNQRNHEQLLRPNTWPLIWREPGWKDTVCLRRGRPPWHVSLMQNNVYRISVIHVSSLLFCSWYKCKMAFSFRVPPWFFRGETEEGTLHLQNSLHLFQQSYNKWWLSSCTHTRTRLEGKGGDSDGHESIFAPALLSLGRKLHHTADKSFFMQIVWSTDRVELKKILDLVPLRIKAKILLNIIKCPYNCCACQWKSQKWGQYFCWLHSPGSVN